MTIMKKVKTAGSFIMDVLEVVSPVVVTGLFLTKPSKYKPIVTYSDVIVAITDSGMWSDDRVKLISELPMGQNSEFYKAVIYVTKTSLLPSDKAKLILEMYKKVGS